MVEWLKDCVFYEIYPQSFYDTNGDGIGDIQGIIEKLDYIKDLGCNALWLNPCFDSPFKDAGYDVRDYKKVASRYGTNEDLVRLFEEAHKRDMHVLLDLVPGHTSEEHPWFLESQKAETNEYSNRYIWTDHCFSGPKNMPYIGGESERSGTYILNFFKCQPALNYGFYEVEENWELPMDHPDCIATREALKDIMRYWLDLGCDGYRVDMAASLVKNDDDKKTGTSMIWKNIRQMLDEEYPQAALVSEWGKPELALKAGFHMDFMLHMRDNKGVISLMRDNNGDQNRSFFKKDSDSDIMTFLDEYLPIYKDICSIGYYCPISGNHDMKRLTTSLNEEEMKLAYAFLFTIPGVPFLYYGDEIGMKYLELPTKEGGYFRTGSRTPMQWNHSKNLGFSTAEAEKLYLPVDSAEDAPTVEDQLKDENSLLNVVKKILKIRHTYEEFKDHGNFEVVYAEHKKLPFVYRRGSLIMAVNPSSAKCSVELEQADKEVFVLGGYEKEGNTVTLSPQSFVIFQ